MNFMLDKTTYDLLLKISNSVKYRCLVFDDNLRYLEHYQFISYEENNNSYYFTILPKGRVALRNYEENEKLIFFNKCISIVTLSIATATLIVAIITLFITLK